MGRPDWHWKGLRVHTTQDYRPDDLVALFGATFTASEGAEEGAVIGAFVDALMTTTPADDLRVFTARDGAALIGGAVFTRLRFGDDPRRVMILSPMAVATDRQGKCVGQALLQDALGALRAEGVAVAITYGDPAFYGHVGFQPLNKGMAPAPLPLSHPHGWIGQSLTDAPLTPLPGPCFCVPALNNPDLW